MNKEIIWNIVNSFLMAGAIILGGLSTGNITTETITFALIAGGIVAISQFKNYWDAEKPEYTCKTFGKFI
jgi:hypothetical protein